MERSYREKRLTLVERGRNGYVLKINGDDALAATC